MTDHQNVSKIVNVFSEEVLNDPTAFHQLSSAKDLDSLVDTAHNMTKERGYNFTPEEIKNAVVSFSSSQQFKNGESESELDDSLLLAVAGGKDDTQDIYNTQSFFNCPVV